MHELDTLYDICETLNRELEEANEKIRKAGGKMSAGDLEVVDKLTHAIKSVKTTIAMIEAEGDYSRDYDGMGGNSMNRRSMDSRTMRDRSNARNRIGNVRRDNMGRYSRAEAEDAMMDALEDYMETVTDPTKKREVERFMDKMVR
jgi:hypothetical protein